MIFWKIPNGKKMAFIPRTGSTAWGQAILEKYYPNLKDVQTKAHMPKGMKPSAFIPQFLIPNDQKPLSVSINELVAVTRDPIERFRSAFSRLNSETVDEAIEKIKAAKNIKEINIHVRPVAENFAPVAKAIKWYAYEQDLEKLAIEIGFEDIPARLNVSTEEKPSLSRNQLQALREIYAADIKLHEDTLRG
jgi:hypothetical protein